MSAASTCEAELSDDAAETGKFERIISYMTTRAGRNPHDRDQDGDHRVTEGFAVVPAEPESHELTERVVGDET